MANPLIKRGPIRSVVGIEVSELNLTFLVNSDVQVANVPMTQFAREGGFDGARVQLDRYFSASWDSTACGSVNLFNGRVATLTVSGSEIAMAVKADIELLNIMMPRNIYMAQCQHTLFDSGCNISAAAFTVTGNTTANSTTTAVHSNLSQADGYFALGVMKYVSGENNQVQRSVRMYANGTLTPMPPLPATPAAGDLFTVRPGCDKLHSTCDVTFNNTGNFRGYEFIPAPETTY